jgi:hypothetical protein
MGDAPPSKSRIDREVADGIGDKKDAISYVFANPPILCPGIEPRILGITIVYKIL